MQHKSIFVRLPEGSEIRRIPPPDTDITALREVLYSYDQRIPEACTDGCIGGDSPCDAYISRERHLSTIRSLQRILNWLGYK